MVTKWLQAIHLYVVRDRCPFLTLQVFFFLRLVFYVHFLTYVFSDQASYQQPVLRQILKSQVHYHYDV